MGQIATPLCPHNPDVDVKTVSKHRQKQGKIQCQSSFHKTPLDVCGD